MDAKSKEPTSVERSYMLRGRLLLEAWDAAHIERGTTSAKVTDWVELKDSAKAFWACMARHFFEGGPRGSGVRSESADPDVQAGDSSGSGA